MIYQFDTHLNVTEPRGFHAAGWGLWNEEQTHGFLGVLVVTVLPGEATLNRAVALLDLILEGVKCVRTNLRKARVTLESFSGLGSQYVGVDALKIPVLLRLKEHCFFKYKRLHLHKYFLEECSKYIYIFNDSKAASIILALPSFCET